MQEILDRLTARLSNAPTEPFETPQLEMDIRTLVAVVKTMRETLKVLNG